MKTKRIVHSKKAQIGALFAVIILAAAAGLIAWKQHRDDSAPAVSIHTTSTCTEYSSATYDPVWPDSIADVSKESYGVIVGTALNPTAYGRTQSQAEPPQVRITNVLKGDEKLHVGDTLSLCPWVGMLGNFTGDNHTVLIFLEGTNDNVWVPNRGFLGIIPQGKDNLFQPKWAKAGPSPVTVDDLEKLVK